MSRQLSDRKVLGFPPYRRILELTGAGADIDEMIGEIGEVEELLREDAEDGQRSVSAYPFSAGDRVGTRVAEIIASRSAKKQPQVRVRIDDPRSL